MTADQSNPGVLVNAPVKFAGATPDVIVTPPPPAGVPVVGLPQSSFREVIKRDGSREGAVQAVVDPPLVGRPYLNIALYMKGPRDARPQLIERRPVAPANQNDPVYFDVFQSLLNDGVYVFWYEVERTSGNSGPSTEAWALHFDNLPGGNDVPGTGDHPYLAISLPPELGDPPQIGKDEVDKGVRLKLSYPYMLPYDKIILEMGRERFVNTVQPGEENGPYEFQVNRAMFEQAGNHPELPFSFTVISQVNDPTDKRRWSTTIKANVNINRVVLPAPVLSEVLNDESDLKIIDLDKVKDFVYVQLHALAPQWEKDDIVRIIYICTLPTGSAVTHRDEKKLVNLPFFPNFEVPVAKVWAGGKITVIYEQVRGGEIVAASKGAEAAVEGKSIAFEDFESYRQNEEIYGGNDFPLHNGMILKFSKDTVIQQVHTGLDDPLVGKRSLTIQVGTHAIELPFPASEVRMTLINVNSEGNAIKLFSGSALVRTFNLKPEGYNKKTEFSFSEHGSEITRVEFECVERDGGFYVDNCFCAR